MFEFGDNAVSIWAAYGISAIVLFGLVLRAMMMGSDD